jgi:hypothetical protein
MRRGDRIELLKKLADRLAADDYSWEDRRLVLYQFGFRVSDPHEWEGTARAYLIWHLEDANDETLVELDEYLFSGSSRETLDAANLPWESGAFRLFISHTSPNAALAGELRGYFAPWRIDAFVAHVDVEPVREWEHVIEAALSSCHALAALVTDDFVRSKWCDQEVGYCLARHIPIVPVRHGVDPHGFIAKFQAARVAQPGTAPWIADGIFRALARHAAVRELMVAPVVHRFATTRSYEGARANFPLLQELPAEAWTRELVDIAERATQVNSQLKNANLLHPTRSVPDATAELLAPIRERLGMDVPIDTGIADDDIPF